MKPDEFFNLLSSPPPGLSSKSEFQLLIDDMKKYTTVNVDFHQGDLLAHSAWTAFYVSELFDIKSTNLSPLQSLYYEDIVKDFEAEGLYSIDVKKVLILAAFLHDIGKAGDGKTRYYDKEGHEKTGALYLFNNNYTSVIGTRIDLERILKDFKVTVLEKDIIICLIAGHWLIGDTMTSDAVNKEEYFVSEFIGIVYNFISDSDLQENIPFVDLMCMLQLIICVADVLASQEYKGKLKIIKDFPDIPLEHATHRGMDAYNRFNYDDIINNFVPKVFTVINDGNFIKGTNVETTEDLVNKLINNAASISPEEFGEAIGTISENGDYNIDQLSDVLLEYINIGDFKRVYIILDNFPNDIGELLDVIEINNGIPDFIKYILTISSKQKLNTIIGDIIYTHKIKFIEELIKVNFKFTPYFLGIARTAYKKASNIIDEGTADDIFELIKNNYDFSDYYINDKHKIFCETLVPTLDDVPDALQITTTRVLIPFDKILEDNFTPDFLDSFPSPKKGMVDITYEKDNYGGGFENTVDVEKGYIFHNDWIIQSINYIKGLNYEDIFTLYGYSHNGDEFSNKYLIGNNQSYLEFVNTHINYDSFERYSTKYFPLFFQLLNLLNKYKEDDIVNLGEDPAFIRKIKKTNKAKDKYNLLIKNLDNIQINIIKEATSQYIKDLDRIIKNGPPLSHDVVLYRGVKDKYYYPDPNNKIFVNNTFMSTSYTIFNAYEFANTECCVKKIFCKAGTPAIFLECITSHPTENEILLGLNNKFEILKDEVRNNFEVQSKFSDICEVVKGKMNVTTMITV
jgi:hypothetical protein